MRRRLDGSQWGSTGRISLLICLLKRRRDTAAELLLQRPFSLQCCRLRPPLLGLRLHFLHLRSDKQFLRCLPLAQHLLRFLLSQILIVLPHPHEHALPE